MTDKLIPMGSNAVGPANDARQVDVWQVAGGVQPLPVNPIQRPLAALRRYKWMIVVVIILSAIGGLVATRTVEQEYSVSAMLWMQGGDGPLERMSGAARGILNNDDWTTLLKSFRVADGVVKKLTLYLETESDQDRTYFHGFTIDTLYLPSEYELVIDRERKRWVLTAKPTMAVDSGAMLDSVGVKFGLKWQLEKPVFNEGGGGKREIKFTVATPREAAAKMIERLKSQRVGEFLRLSLLDPDPKLAANIVNTWLSDFSTTSAFLKQRKLVETADMLETQLKTAKDSMEAAEVRYQRHRVNTITLPSEGGNTFTPGVQETTDPAVRSYFSRKIEAEDIRQDILFIKKLVDLAAVDSVPPEAILPPTARLTGAAAEGLRAAISEYTKVSTELRRLRLSYLDSYPQIKLGEEIRKDLKTVAIPVAAANLISALNSIYVNDSIRLESASQDLKSIPERMIQDERLRRNVEVNRQQYMALQNQNAQAQLAKMGSTPDMMILDSAIAPLQPNKNTPSRVILVAIGGGIAFAIALAILLDFFDWRVRYPEQVTNELGLAVAGTVPKFPKGGVDQNSPEQMYQLVESFRSLRMSVLHAGSGTPVSLAISSPQPGDGKSLISANLAMSFADAGLRTILVDGDTRRGALHDVFNAANVPGLTDYLAGTAELEDILRPTGDPKLSVIPCGTRRRRSPELLTSPRLAGLVEELRTMYEVVIFDTPPLAAGIDGYSIATATGNLLLVLRVGATKRRLCAEKLRIFDRLPVSVIGAVMNGLSFDEGNEHYSYVAGYDVADETPGTALAEVP